MGESHGYLYSEQREKLFTEKGQVLFMKVRDRVKEILPTCRAFRMDVLLDAGWDVFADPWDVLACVDRMVELGELTECRYGECAGQHRVFMSNRMA